MPSVLDRDALEESPLADLHLLADELGVDGFRRLRKPDLVDAILSRQSGDEPSTVAEETSEVEAVSAAPADDDQPRRSRRGRRGGRGRRRDEDEGAEGQGEGEEQPVAAAAEVHEPRESREPRETREPRESREAREPREPRGEERSVEGAVELLANGSGFLRLSPPDATDDDVYISAAQVKRCELVSGDRVAGPVRAARRSERYPSLIRVDTINGRPADEVAEGTRFEDLPVAWPSERIELGSEDPTVKAIEWLTPFGKGSRVVIAGPSRAGKSEALRRLALALATRPELEVSAVLVGVRPEEIADFPVAPGAALNFSASVDAQAQAVEQAVEVGRRVAARGGDAVVLVDGFEYLPASVARRTLAAGRNLAGAGSLTIIATSPAPVGGETTVVVLDRALAAAGSFPALALGESGTLRPELLVGRTGAEAIQAAGADTAPEAAVVPEPAIEVVADAVVEAVSEAEPEAAPEVQAEPEAAPEVQAEPEAKPAAKRSRTRAAKATPAKKAPATAKKAAAKSRAAATKKPAASAAKPKAAAARKPAAAAKAKPAAKAKAAATKKPAARKRAARKPAAN